jgi:hypothetical protein
VLAPLLPSVLGLRLVDVLCSLEYVACGRRTRYVLRTFDSEVHPSCIHGLSMRMAERPIELRPLADRGWRASHSRAGLS